MIEKFLAAHAWELITAGIAALWLLNGILCRLSERLATITTKLGNAADDIAENKAELAAVKKTVGEHEVAIQLLTRSPG